MRFLLSALVLGAAATSGYGQTLPQFSVEDKCRMIAGIGGSFSDLTYRGCLGLEQRAHERLTRNWTALPADVRIHCVKVAMSDSNGSYSVLQGCIRLELDSASASSSRY